MTEFAAEPIAEPVVDGIYYPSELVGRLTQAQQKGVDGLIAEYRDKHPPRFEIPEFKMTIMGYVMLTLALSYLSIALKKPAKSDEIRPEVRAQFASLLQPGAQYLGKVAAIGSANNGDKPTQDKRVKGGVKLVYSGTSGRLDYTVDAWMLEKGGQPDPKTTYEAYAVYDYCQPSGCSSPEEWQETIVEGDPIGPDGYGWAGRVYHSPADSTQFKTVLNTEFKDPNSSLDSPEVKKALYDARQIEGMFSNLLANFWE